MGITLKQAKSLQYGQVLYHTMHKDSTGMPSKWRVAGMPKTWKTRPHEVQVPMRYGMQKTTEYLTESELGLFEMSEWRATGTKITFKKVDGPRFQYYDVIFGKQKVPYKRKYEDRRIGNVFRDKALKCWFNNQERYRYKTRQAAAEGLLDTMLD